MSERQKRNQQIDWLRAFSVSAVVFFHIAPGYFPNGFLGVDIFFLVSGYLVGGKYIYNDIGVATYYKKRFLRIIPPMWAALAISLIGASIWLYPSELVKLLSSIPATIFFIYNYDLANSIGYFNSKIFLYPVAHLWSLSVEAQFYLLLPLISLIATKSSNNKLSAIFLFIGTAFVFVLYNLSDYTNLKYYSLFPRLLEFSAGILLYSYRDKIEFGLLPALLSSTLLVFLVLDFGPVQLSNKGFGWPTFHLVYLLLLVAVFLRSDVYKKTWIPYASSLNFIFVNNFVQFIGRSSYSIYLLHWPIISFFLIGYYPNSIPQNIKLGLLVGCFIAGAFLYHFIEKNSKIFLSLSMLIIALLLAAPLNNLIYSSNSKNAEEFLKQSAWPDSLVSDSACKNTYLVDHYCLSDKNNNEITSVLIGDSHANHFYPGLKMYLKNKGENGLLHVGAGGCAPTFYLDWVYHPKHGNLNCQNRLRFFYDLLKTDNRIKNVYLAFHNAGYYDENIQVEIHPDLYVSKNSSIIFDDSILNMADFLIKNGKRVYLIKDIPDLTDEPLDCLSPRGFMDKPRCDLHQINLSDLDYRYLDLIKKLQIIDVDIIDLEKGRELRFYNNGIYMFRDKTHLSLEGSKILFEGLK